MSDDAVFRATFAGMRSLTDGSLRFSYDVDGPEIQRALDVLTQGGMPSAAKGDWFAIARLNNNGGAAFVSAPSAQPTTAGASRNESAPVAIDKKLGRTLSQNAYLLCNQPSGRVYLEQKRRHAIPSNNQINNTDEAKDVLRAWLGVQSLSELDRDSAAADRWERVEADYKTWLIADRYVETP